MNDNENEIQDEHELIAARRDKLNQLREQGFNFPNTFRPSAFIGEIKTEFTDSTKEALEDKQHKVAVAGRIMTRRLMGKASFTHIQDMSGRLQVYLKKNMLAEGQYDQFKSWDLGDIVAIEGVLFKTQTGELSIKAESVQLLTKAIRPLPDKYHGLADKEQRYRKRYLDLITNEASRKVFSVRSQVITALRQYLIQHHYLEVETPMMHVIPGGAAAKPFVTFHNALDMELYLRIAPELYLKRLVVGGFERVFEINRNFRNEGLSTQHNPEFTMVEFYSAYSDYQDLMDLTEDLLKTLANDVLGTTMVKYHEHQLDFGKPFTRMTVAESILEYNPDLTAANLQDIQKLKQKATGLGIECLPEYGLGKIQIEIFEKTVEHRLIQPTFITAYPTEVSPLARRNIDDPFITDRFELFIAGREIANGFSELNDPEDQAERFRAQAKAKDSGDEEAMYFDEEYITALEYGMPPTAGEGIGIDRLVMLFTDSPSIRDVILFPQLRLKAL